MYPLFPGRHSLGTPTSALADENFGFSAPAHTSHHRTFRLEGLEISAASTAHGSYHTVYAGDVWQADTAAKTRCLRVLSAILEEYIRRAGICLRNCRTLVCGLGNGEITSDSLGSAVCRRIPVYSGMENNSEIYVLCPGVPARTGIPTDALVKAAAELIHADLLITADALCARSINRLASVIQVTDSGITPGSGNSESPLSGEISTRTMPCPVLTVGVPTVISSSAMLQDLMGENTAAALPAPMPVSHTAIDAIIHGYSEIIAGAVTRTLLTT